jgi:hypothetical protein
MMDEIAPSSVEDQGPAAIPDGNRRAAVSATIPHAPEQPRIDMRQL